MSVYAPMVGLLWRALEDAGLNPAQFIDSNEYDPCSASLGDRRVSLETFLHLQERVMGLLRSEDVGLKMARHLHPSHLGPLGYAWLASSSLRTALYRVQRFMRMFNEQAAVEIEERDDWVTVHYQLDRSHAFPLAHADFQYGALLTMCRWNAGPELRPARMALRRPEPTDSTPWVRFFGRGVLLFSQGRNAISFRAEDVERRSTGSNPMLVSVHEDLIRRHLDGLRRSELERAVQNAIIDHLPSGDVSEATVASLMGVSRRTLRRHLQRQGVSFRSLLEEARKELAGRYLRDSAYNITDIAFLLGFSEPSAFARAFRRWHGVSPTKFREQEKWGQSQGTE